MKTTRRNHLATMGGALLAASSLAPAEAGAGPKDQDAEVLYGHGQVWNRALAGILGELKLAFDLRVNLETGAGFGAAGDPVFPDWNVHFAINSTQQEKYVEERLVHDGGSGDSGHQPRARGIASPDRGADCRGHHGDRDRDWGCGVRGSGFGGYRHHRDPDRSPPACGAIAGGASTRARISERDASL